MSIQFSDTTNKKGLIQLIDRNCRTNATSYSLLDKTADINIALDFVWATIFKCGGKWQWDDSSHIDFPIISTNLVSGQRDYSFVTDEQGNIILDIYKVLIAQPDGKFVEIKPVDVQSESGNSGFYDGNNLTGTPTKYDKTANAIFLDVIPNYNSTNGLKVYINREGSYFTSSDTTKKAGFAGTFHEILALRPSYQYAHRNGLSNAKALQTEFLLMLEELKDYYGNRERDVKKRMKANTESTR